MKSGPIKLIVVLSVTYALSVLKLGAQSAELLIRGVAPHNPIEHYNLRQEAFTALVEKEYAKAAEGYQRLCAIYSVDSENWYRLGLSYYFLGAYGKTGDAFQRAHELGVPAYARWLCKIRPKERSRGVAGKSTA